MSLNDLSVVNKIKKKKTFFVLKIKCCSSYTNIEMKLSVSQTLICTTADDILLFEKIKGYYDKKTINI